MIQFAWGVLAALSLVAALFFVRFWRMTKERLFAVLATAFGVFAIHWTWLGLGSPFQENSHYVYALRFIAFALIMLGVLDKNRSTKRRA
jgi:hypothetical protein